MERLGNALPDPALIFVGMIAVLMALSAFGAAAGWSALNPVTGETLSVTSLLSGTVAAVAHCCNPRMMAKGLEGMLPYLVLVFFAAQFVAMFGWSNLGPITAIVGADQFQAMQAPPALLLPTLTTMSAWLDFLIASSTAKWTAMAPVATPMLMLLGIP